MSEYTQVHQTSVVSVFSILNVLNTFEFHWQVSFRHNFLKGTVTNGCINYSCFYTTGKYRFNIPDSLLSPVGQIALITNA